MKNESNPLPDYSAYPPSNPDASGYIDYLQRTRYPNGELLRLPSRAVILFDAQPSEHLAALGIQDNEIERFEIGTTVACSLHVVRKSRHGAFLLAAGQPGAGGVATQVTELVALGAKTLIHIGTCDLLGNAISPGTIILASQAISDVAGLLLQERKKAAPRVVTPDAQLVKSLRRSLPKAILATGYCAPLYYGMPKALFAGLLSNLVFPDHVVRYIEMEQGAFFASCSALDIAGASLVCGADTISLNAHGKLVAEYGNIDQDASKREMLQAALNC